MRVFKCPKCDSRDLFIQTSGNNTGLYCGDCEICNEQSEVQFMYRVYDTKENKWVKDGIYLSPNNDLSTLKKSVFGTKKLTLVSNQRYVDQRDIGLNDKNGNLIFEGDICKIEQFNVVGVVAYTPHYAAYHLFDYEHSMYYILSTEKCKFIEIIGNIFDTPDLIPQMKGGE